MGLSINTNLSTLRTTQGINSTTQSLETSLRRLTTGLRINGAEDGPGTLVLSESNKAQLSGIGTALSNTGKAYAMVSVADSAMKELSDILTSLRSSAVDAANRGVQDPASTAAAQADIKNLLQTFDRIVNQTQYGTKKLLTGVFAPTVTNSNSANSIAIVTGTVKNETVASGAINAIVTSGARAATVVGATVVAGSPGANAVTLTINGVNIGLSASNVTGGTDTLTVNDTVAAINAFSSQTGVTAYNDTTRVRLVSNTFGAGGNFTASLKVDSGTDFTGISGSVASTGLTTLTVASGSDIVGTINGQSGIGSGSTLSSADGNVRITYYQGSVNRFTSDATATQLAVNYANAQTFQIGNNAGDTMGVLIRDLRASALGRGTIGLNSVTDPLGIASAAATATFGSLADINVTTSRNAADAVRIIDNAIAELNGQRSVLGSFLSSGLTPTEDNLSSVLEATTSLQSTLVDTNYAEEIAQQTKLLVQAEAQAAILKSGQQLNDLVLGILN